MRHNPELEIAKRHAAAILEKLTSMLIINEPLELTEEQCEIIPPQALDILVIADDLGIALKRVAGLQAKAKNERT